MAYSILGLITGLGIARSKDLEGVSAAKVAVIPGLLGFNIVSLVLAKVVADQEAESLPPPDAEKATIEVSPTSHNYVGVNIGSSAFDIFVVKNIGGSELDISAINLLQDSGLGSRTSPFAIVSGGGPLKLAAGEIHNVVVMFSPNSDIEVFANLIITSNDPDRPIVTIGLSGTGVNTLGIEVTPVFRDYGSHFVTTNSIRITKCFIVSNKGDSKLELRGTLSGDDPDKFAIESEGFFTIDSGTTHDVEVSFITGTLGEHHARLNITHNDNTRRSVDVELKGTVILPSSPP